MHTDASPQPPLHAVIVDDEARCRNALQHLLKMHCPQVVVEAQCASVKTALERLPGVMPDILFLDVLLEDGTGFDVLQSSDCRNTAVIFTTAHDEYALKAIKFSALDYLLKPVDSDELISSVGKVHHHRRSREIREKQFLLLHQNLAGSGEQTTIALPTLDGFSFVDLVSIITCQAQSNYTEFRLLRGEKLVVCKTLKEYEDLLEEHGFVRIHRSHIINLRHLKKYVRGKGGYVVMSDGSEIEVSSRCKDALLKRVKL